MSTATLPRPRQSRRRSADDHANPSEQLLSIPIERLHRHPDNRTITTESVTELAESLREHGQKEPIRVRALADPIGHYEILSGERRYVAAGVACIDEMRCIVETHDDAAALLELAVANAAREDLDPIERAELLQKLIDSGMDRAAAGRVFGLGSDSGIKNALRLLNLPAYYRELIATKRINVQQARLLVPYPDALLDALAVHLQAKKQSWLKAHFFEDANGTDNALRSFVRENTRPMDRRKYYHGYQLGQHPALFKPDEKQTEALKVVRVPDRNHGAKQGAELTVALNTKLWHTLQDPLAKAAAAKRSAKHAAKAKVKTGDAPPTAEDLKKRRAEQDRQLDSFTSDWLRTALRCQLSTRYEWTDGCIEYSLPWLLGRLEASNRYGDPDLQTLHQWAISQCRLSAGSRLDSVADFSRQMCLVALEFPLALWRVALWPVASEETAHDDLAPSGQLPERLPTLNEEDVDALAEMVGVSVETVWKAATVDGPLRQLVRQWLMRHTADQRTDLRKELKINGQAAAKRDADVDQILAAHTAAKPLTLPKRFAKCGS